MARMGWTSEGVQFGGKEESKGTDLRSGDQRGCAGNFNCQSFFFVLKQLAVSVAQGQMVLSRPTPRFFLSRCVSACSLVAQLLLLAVSLLFFLVLSCSRGYFAPHGEGSVQFVQE